MARIRERHWVPRLRRLTKSDKTLLWLSTFPSRFQEQLNLEVREFRPTRDTAMAVRVRMQDIADKEQAN